MRIRRRKYKNGFTLVELLVVIAIIAIVAAILFPVFSRAKAAAKSTDCLANINQLVKATMLYAGDNDGRYPMARRSDNDPWLSDADGSLEEPDYGSIFPRLDPYLGAKFRMLVCPEDRDPKGDVCFSINPDVPNVGSYLYNGSFAFGQSDTGAARPAETIQYIERRSESVNGTEPFCNYMYRPWFNQSNPYAPEDDMDATIGAPASTRHNSRANYGFMDGHAKNLVWSQTFDLAHGVNLHKVN